MQRDGTWEEEIKCFCGKTFGQTIFKDVFPRLYSISLDQGKKVGEVGVWLDSDWQWRLRWRRNKFEWKVPQEEELMRTISRINMNKETKDIQIWRGDGSWAFTVKFAFSYLSNQVNITNTVSCSKMLGNAKALPNVAMWWLLDGGY